jgi:hypothetical protein
MAVEHTRIDVRGACDRRRVPEHLGDIVGGLGDRLPPRSLAAGIASLRRYRDGREQRSVPGPKVLGAAATTTFVATSSRAHALGMGDAIPNDWNAGGSLSGA